MNHDEIRALMAAYVDDELPGSQRKLVEGHVAGCATCRAELAAVTALQRQIGKRLAARAEMVVAPAESWAALQARIGSEPATAMPAEALRASGNHSRAAADEPGTQRRLLRTFSMGFALAGVLVFLWVIFSPMVTGPGDEAGRKTKTPTPTLAGTDGGVVDPGGEPTATVVGEGPAGSFIPLTPTRLPEGTAYMDDANGPGGVRLLTFYNKKGNSFLQVTQSAISPDEPLPGGEATTVANLPGVSTGGLSGKVKAGTRNITYKDARGLTWQTPFGTRINIVSNLPNGKIAEFAGAMAVTFTRFNSAAIPQVDQWGSKGLDGIDGGLLLSENHLYGETHFIIVSQGADIGQAAPDGEPIALPNGTQATIARGLSGTAPILADTFFEGKNPAITGGGGGGGGGGGPDYVEPVYQQTLNYSDGVRLVWTQDGTRIDVLTNVSEQDALAYAAGMEQAPSMNGLITGAYVDYSVLPQGGALAGYVITAPELPSEFYHYARITVTGGDGEIMESRYSGNEVFAIITTRRDDGSKLPDGDAVKIGGQDGVVTGGQNGTALLRVGDGGWVTTLQDGIPRLFLGMSSGSLGDKDPSATDLTYPETLSYKDGQLLTWTRDGARLTLLTNLSQADALDIAGKLTILGKDYTILSPNSQNTMGQVFVDGYDVWGPTYLPGAIQRLAPADPETPFSPDALYWNEADPSQFVIIRQRAAQKDESVNTPLNRVLLGQPVLIRQVSGSFDFRYSETPHTVAYTDAVEITVIVDGTWIQIITSLPMDEANKIGEGLVKGK